MAGAAIYLSDGTINLGLTKGAAARGAGIQLLGFQVPSLREVEQQIKKPLGLIYPGEFHFGTDAPERMDIISGACRIRLDGTSEWKDVSAGSFFKVPGKSGFDITVKDGIAEYVCSFE